MARGGKREKTPLPPGVHVWHGGFTCKLEPTTTHAQRCARLGGARRHVYNWMLDRVNTNNKTWQEQRAAGVPKEERVPPLDNRESHDVFKANFPDWWVEAKISFWVYRKAIDDCCTAFTKFTHGEASYPVQARKSSGEAKFSFQGNDVVLTEAGKIRLPTIGWVPIVGSPSNLADLRRKLRRGRAKLLRVTVRRHADGSWWVSGIIEHQARTQPKHPNPTNPVVGADRGLKTNTIAATSAGTVVAELGKLQQHKKDRNRIARLSRTVSRRYQPGKPAEEQSANYHKARKQLGKHHERTRLRRQDARHCLTKTLTTTSPVIVLDGVPTKMMLSNKHLARDTSAQGHYEIRRQLEYKALWSGGQVIVADQFYPSSKRCSQCGWVKPKLSLSERAFRCTHCGFTSDRDVNAAVNLAVWGETMLANPDLSPAAITGLLCVYPTPGTGTHPAGQEPTGSTPANHNNTSLCKPPPGGGVMGGSRPVRRSRTRLVPSEAGTVSDIVGD